MANVGDVLEWQVNSTFLSGVVNMMQVWQFEITVSSEATITLATAGDELGNLLFDAVYEHILLCTSVNVRYTGGLWKNLSDPTEIGSFIIPGGVIGAGGGDALPPYSSYSFLLRRLNATTRNGHKRFAGIPENAQANGIAISSIIDELELAADVFGNPIDIEFASPSTLTLTLAPRIVRKNAAGAMTLSQPVLSAEYTGIGTQNTRKYGRGM